MLASHTFPETRTYATVVSGPPKVVSPPAPVIQLPIVEDNDDTAASSSGAPTTTEIAEIKSEVKNILGVTKTGKRITPQDVDSLFRGRTQVKKPLGQSKPPRASTSATGTGLTTSKCKNPLTNEPYTRPTPPPGGVTTYRASAALIASTEASVERDLSARPFWVQHLKSSAARQKAFSDQLQANALSAVPAPKLTDFAVARQPLFYQHDAYYVAYAVTMARLRKGRLLYSQKAVARMARSQKPHPAFSVRGCRGRGDMEERMAGASPLRESWTLDECMELDCGGEAEEEQEREEEREVPRGRTLLRRTVSQL